MHTPSAHRRTVTLTPTALARAALLAAAIASAPQPACASVIPGGAGTDEPVTIAIAVGLGTGLAVTLVYDQATANFLSTAFGYAKPQPDAEVGWYLGRGTALAVDWDYRTATMPESVGSCSAAVNWILPDSLDPKLTSRGAYHNVVRTYKNGSLRNAQSGGQPDPDDGVNRVNIDINGFTTNSGRMRISVTGGTGGGTDGPGSSALSAVYKLGAEFDELSNQWVAWTPEVSGSLDPAVAGYYAASNGGEPSIASIADSASAPSCLDFSSLLVAALNSATMVSGSQLSVGAVSIACDLGAASFDTSVSPTVNWWQSVQAEAAADAVIPTPGSLSLVGLGAACLAVRRRR